MMRKNSCLKGLIFSLLIFMYCCSSPSSPDTSGGTSTTSSPSTSTSSTTTTTIANQGPDLLDLGGPANPDPGSTCSYIARGYDPDGTRVSIKFTWEYFIDQYPWSASGESVWSDFVTNNTYVSYSITWTNSYSGGDGEVRAYIKDELGKEGYPSLYLNIKFK